MASTSLEVIISARDKFTGTANRIIGTLGKMDSAAGRVGKGFGQLGAGMARVAVVGAAAAAGGLALVARKSIEWESALAGVNKTMDLTPRELEAIGSSIRKLATTIPLSAVELAGLAEQAGALGIAKDDVVEFSRIAGLLGVTTNVGAEQAATSLGVMSNLLGLTGPEFERFASTLVDLGNKGASTEAQILAIAERAAGAGATVGLSTDQILGFAAAVANIGIEPEAGGSSLQRLFIETARGVAEGDDKLRLFAKTAGMSAAEFKEVFGKDAAGALEAFIDGLAALSKERRLGVLEGLDFNDIRITRMLLGLAEAETKTNNLSNALDIGADAWRSNTAAAVEADKRFGTVGSKLTLLKNQAIEAALLIGEGFLPALGRAADRLGTVLGDERTRNDLRQLGRDIGGFIDSINWSEVIAGAKTFVGLLRTAAQVIGAIPKEITAATVGFIALNNLSGGLIGTGLGNIAGGLGQAVARSGASRLPGVGALFAQPVFVTNWPIGLGAGGAVAGGAGAAGAAGAAAAVAKGGLAIGAVLAAGLALKELIDPGMFAPGSPASKMTEARMAGPVGAGGTRTRVKAQLGMGPFGVGTPAVRKSGVPTAISGGIPPTAAAIGAAVASAIRQLKIAVPSVTVRVNTSVQIRDIDRQRTIVRRAGRVVAI